MAKHHSMKKDKYPESHSFEMAPNKGYGDGGPAKMAAESHASNLPDFGIGHKVSTAMLHDWGHDDYVMHPHSDGSMNYMAEKDMIRKKDNERVKRSFVQPGNAV